MGRASPTTVPSQTGTLEFTMESPVGSGVPAGSGVASGSAIVVCDVDGGNEVLCKIEKRYRTTGLARWDRVLIWAR